MRRLLLQGERDLFRDLLKVQNGLAKYACQIRVVGGWCRDKLVGRSSSDIDISVEGMSGSAFAQLVLDDQITAGAIRDHPLHVIAMNPEQSKHLETAVINMGDFTVDFAGLRSEWYNGDSRIPNVAHSSSIEEDALRRDFTCNAIYYNIAKDEIEDPTGGVADLKHGLLRTPSNDPSLTLHDDPLRALRALRFTATYGFRLDAKLEGALQEPGLVKQLEQKVSRERIHTEWFKILGAPRHGFIGALQLARKYNMGPVVLFPLADGVFERGCQLVEAVDAELDAVDRLVCLLYFSERNHLDSRQLWQRLRAPLRDIKAVTERISLVRRFVGMGASPSTETMGTWLRDCGRTGWRSLVQIGAQLEGLDAQTEISRIEALPLYEAAFSGPVLDGHEITGALGGKAGPLVGRAQQFLFRWSLDNYSPEPSKQRALDALAAWAKDAP